MSSAALALLALTCACAGGPTTPANSDPSSRLQAALERAVSRNPTSGGVLLVDVPGRLHFTGGAGVSDPVTGRRAAADDRFRIASVSKTMTAAVVLELAAEGRIGLDGTLMPYLPVTLLDRLHVMSRVFPRETQSRGREITIRQLLGHQSGLADYFFEADQDRDGVGDMVELITLDPTRHWQPPELLEFAIVHTRPLFAPGTGYHYSDTNYLLLGLVIEAVTRKPLAEVYRERLFRALGMPDTYLQAYEPATPGPPLSYVHFYGRVVPPSVEIPGWGGGGLVSSTEELARFVRALFAGGVFDDAAMLVQMQGWSAHSGGDYGLGLMRRFYPGAELWGHNGYWGSFMYYWPQRRVVICGTLNDSDADARSLVTDVIRIVEDELAAGHSAAAGAAGERR